MCVRSAYVIIDVGAVRLGSGCMVEDLHKLPAAMIRDAVLHATTGAGVHIVSSRAVFAVCKSTSKMIGSEK